MSNFPDFDGGYREPSRITSFPFSKWSDITHQYEPQEDVRITKVELNKDGNLEFTFSKQEEGTLTIRIMKDYTLDPTDYNNQVKEPYTILNDCMNYLAKLQHIAACYVTTDKLKFNFLKEVGINDESDLTKLQDKVVLGKIFTAISAWFVKTVSKYVGDNSKLLKFKFLRQSEVKNYATIPDYRTFPSSVTDPIYTPFCAVMEDTVGCKSVKYTNYERGIRKSGANAYDRSNPSNITPKVDKNEEASGVKDDLPF